MPRTYTMKFEPRTIEHLGLRLYSTLPPVIAELVSNAYDADATKVEVVVPEGPIGDSSCVVVRDFGLGMDADQIQEEYLPIGRDRRQIPGDERTPSGRLVTGRKGIGKLAAFGIAQQLDVRSIRNGNAVSIRLDYAAMKKWADNHGTAYEPEVVQSECGPTTEPAGVTISIRRLRRSKAINHEELRRSLARRLNFIGPGFDVLVNGISIQPGDRVVQSSCIARMSWALDDTPVGGMVDGRPVTGWIGFLEHSSQRDRGIDIFAHGKAAELGSFFRSGTTHAQFARAYVVGEVHADFLDEEDDMISTARNEIVWDNELCHRFESWGQDLLRWASDQWLADRQNRKEAVIVEESGFKEWLESRTPREQAAAQKMISMLAKDDALDPESAVPLLNIIKSSVEHVAFQEFIEEISGSAVRDPVRLLELFNDWRIIESRHVLHVADGRIAALRQLHDFVTEGALEVPDMQMLFRENPWLIGPTWIEPQYEQTYSQMMRKFAGDEDPELPESDRRVDILAVTDSGCCPSRTRRRG